MAEGLRTDRKQVVVNGRMALPVNVTSGVPQGSVLGTLLLLVFMNDLTFLIKSPMSLYADLNLTGPLFRQTLIAYILGA